MSPALPTLGVDPGRTGAACLLASDGRTVLRWWTWCHRRRKAGDVYVVEEGAGGGALRADFECDSVGEAARLVAAFVSEAFAEVLVSVEGLFVPRPKDGFVIRRGDKRAEAFLGKVRNTITLGEVTGEILGPLRGLGGVVRATAGEWRPCVLSLSRDASSDASEAAAMAACRGGLVVGIEDVTSPHLAEAAMIARWGWIQQQTEVGR